MRESKFRVWDSKENKFFEPTYEAYRGNLKDLSISLSGQLIMRAFKHNIPEVNIQSDNEIVSVHCDSVYPGRYHLQQYTGLKDRNGVEIYEGDILSDSQASYVVDFNDGTFRLKSLNNLVDLRCNSWVINPFFEVVGNIYENPELLGEKE